MQGKKIILEVDRSWVFECRDTTLPIQGFIDALKGIFDEKDIEVKQQDFVECEIFITLNKGIEEGKVDNQINRCLDSIFSDDKGKNKEEKITKFEINNIDIPDEKVEKSSVEQTDEVLREESTVKKEQKREKKPKESIMTTDDVEQLIDADEFKKLIEEIKEIGPYFVQHELESVFCSSNLLFSINAGYGLSTYLKVLSQTLSDVGMVGSLKLDVPECIIKEEKSIEEAIQQIRGLPRSRERSVCCIDLSEIVISRQSFVIQELLKYIQSRDDKTLFVFRVPFLEKERLNEIVSILQDVTNIRPITFIPSTDEALFRFAKKRFEAFGFSVQEESKPVFSKLLWIEKHDGRFYGFNTVEKIVNQVIFQKIRNEKEDTKPFIEVKDFERLVNQDINEEVSCFDDLIGMEEVEKKVEEIVSSIEFQRNQRRNGNDLLAPCMHMMFTGNPGCGKTTVARIIGKMLRDKGILSVGNFIEISGRDLVGQFVGQTAPRTAQICRDAYGSVLFIDEAYSLASDERDYIDYGREALTTLIAEMENHRENMVVIFAGYKDEMERLLKTNVGLRDRVPHHIHFDNYSKENLYAIFINMAEKDFVVDEGFKTLAMKFFNDINESHIKDKMFSNGRMVRNLYERVWSKASLRFQMNQDQDTKCLVEGDLEKAINDSDFASLTDAKSIYRIGF